MEGSSYRSKSTTWLAVFVLTGLAGVLNMMDGSIFTGFLFVGAAVIALVRAITHEPSR